ncbi:MAG TPA: tripartite tricarboxylate transporter substrate binding protein [Thermodesulfobacteriota bacterium]
MQRLLIGLLIAGLGAALPAFAAETYPAKPVEIIVPYSAGGGVDLTARILAEHAKAHLGQPMVVVNRTGGGGAVGFTAGAQARPDGYTLTMMTNAALSDEFLVKGARYNYRSFTPLLQVAFDPAVLVVKKGGPYDLPLEGFLDAARKNPGQIRIGAGGNWSAQDITRALLEREAGVRFARVPFPGGAPAVTALIGGHIDAAVAYISEFKGHYDAGTVRPIAVTGEARSPFLPNVPTFAELGVPLPVGVWRIVAAPAGTPPEVVRTLEAALLKGVNEPAAREAFRKAGVNVSVRDAAETRRYLEDQYRFYAQLVKDFGLEPK